MDIVQEIAELGKHHKPTGVKPLPTVLPTNLPEYEVAGDMGGRTLWVVFVIMLIASVAFTAMSWSVPISKRLYHVVTTLIVLIATVSYFAMAAGNGRLSHHIHLIEEHKHTPSTSRDIYRDVYWARYVDWALTTPLLLFDLAILAGLSGGNILIAISADIFMIVTGLFAAFGSEQSPQKWGYYTIGCVAYLVIVWQLVVNGRSGAQRKGARVSGFFNAIAGFTLLLWTAYPVVWGFADGSRVLSVDNEIIAYAILDVLAKPVFGLWLLLTHMNLPETHVELTGFWAHGFASEGTIRVGDDDEGA